MSEDRQATARQRYYQEKLRRRKLRTRFFMLSFVVILLLSGVITFLIELPGKLKTSGNAPDASASTSEVGPGQTPPEVTGVLGPQLAQTITYTKPTATLLGLPANGRVDMGYFSDALFIGDSLTRGFQVYSSGISNAHYAAYVGAGPKQLISGTVTNNNGEVVTAIDEILAAAPKKVYILLGTNALPLLEDEAFLKYYGDFLDFLLPQLPADTVYYLQGIPPVTDEMARSNEEYSNARIAALNEQLAQMAYARGLCFLNLPQVLSDDAGALRTELVAGTDGIHLNDAGYEVWREFLVTHTAYSKSSPYIGGSPYMPVV